MTHLYNQAILGGTFDRLHVGHQKLIDTAFSQAEHMIIGVSKPSIYKSKLLATNIEEYTIREARVIKYLEKKQYKDRATIIPITDIYGNTLTEKNIDAIFVTEENLPNVTIINNKRKEIGFPLLKIIIVAYVTGPDGKIVTSERIRMGEITSTGHSFVKIFETKDVLSMPEDLRESLREPIGTIVSDISEILPLVTNKFLITVGDIVSQSFKDAGRPAEVSVIDLKTRRHEISLPIYSGKERVVNKPGTINKKAVYVYQKMVKHALTTKEKQTLIIDGEEDLLALPAIVLSPLGSIVLYGQQDLGIVVNEVTEEKKKQVEVLLNKFV